MENILHFRRKGIIINTILCRKWASFLAIVALSFAAPFCLAALGIFSGSSAVCLYGASFVLSMMSELIQILRRRNMVIHGKLTSLNLDHAKEREMAAVIKQLAKKAKIAMPTVCIQQSKKSAPFLGAFANSWPYLNQITFSQDLITVYGKGLTREIFAAKMAHEISHIQHHDARNEEILKVFKLTVLLSCLIALGTISILSTHSFGSVFFPMGVIGAIVLLTEFFFCMWRRAKETLADLNAVSLTEQPQAVVNFLYDRYYQLLYFARLAYEGKDGGVKMWRFDNKESKASLKEKYDHYQAIPRKVVYGALKKEAKALRQAHRTQSQVPGVLWRYTNACYKKASSWFCDYPRCDERAAVVLSTDLKPF